MIETYHRPATLEEALTLLSAPGAVALGGGTALVPTTGAPVVVDLQGLGLDDIVLDGERVVIGAMARLADLAEADLAPPLLRDLARREAPNTIRNVATVAGTVATGDPESELLAGLLVHQAAVTVAGNGTRAVALADYLASPPNALITAVSVAPGGTTASARTGRTPADRPIVMVAARRDENGTVWVAATGVADTPILIDPGADLDPPSDFRADAAYRSHLAETLAARAVAGLGT